MGNSGVGAIVYFFSPFILFGVVYTVRSIIVWRKYIERLKYFRHLRQIMRERGEDVGDDSTFETSIYIGAWRGDVRERINPRTGMMDPLPPHGTIPLSENFLLNNWNKYAYTDSEDVCSICLNKMSNVDSIINLHISQHSISKIESKSNREIESQGNLVDDDPVQIPCGHIFHEKCIRNWAVSHDSCPVCRFQPKTCKPVVKRTENIDYDMGSPPRANITHSRTNQVVGINNTSNQSEIRQALPSRNSFLVEQG